MLDAERTQAALTHRRTRRTRSLATKRTPQHKSKSMGGPPRHERDAHAKNPGHRGSWGQAGRVGASGRVRGWSGQGLKEGVQGEGSAHLFVEDAEEVLDAIRFQGVG